MRFIRYASVLLACGSLSCGSSPTPFGSSGGATGSGGASAAAAGASGAGSIPPIMLSGSGGVLFDGAVERASRAAPIVAGTLEVARDGSIAVAADGDRDRLFIVELGARTVREIALESGAEPGRLAEGPAGTWYALLRRGGGLLVVDTTTASVTQRVPLCAAPRGLAYEPSSNAIHVACRQGRLFTLDATTFEIRRELRLADDLRDVIVRGSDLVLTRFRSAELLVLNQNGELVRRFTPRLPNCGAVATTAYRAVMSPNGSLLLAHQASSNEAIGVSAGSYGSSCGGPIVNPLLSVAWVDQPDPTPQVSPSGVTPPDPVDQPALTMKVRSLTLSDASGPFDVAASSVDGRVAVLASGNAWTTEPELLLGVPDPENASAFDGPGFSRIRFDEEPVAVAFDPRGHWIVQSREPAALIFEDQTRVVLSATSAADTGLALFYRRTPAGISCASCHPDGEEDGHTWHFGFGLRRTQTIAGGILSRAPFHWNGELPAMTELVSEVMLKRMKLDRGVTVPQVTRLAEWMDAIAAPPLEPVDAMAAERGKALFDDAVVACASCHSGPQFSDNELHDVGTGGSFQTPTLLSVALRAPFMHDGCAETLEDRFGLCGGGDQHGVTSHLSDAERADLLVYLRSL